MKLNERQRRFADEYVISGVAYSAAVKAGYSEKYANVGAHKLLANVRIAEYIAKRMDELNSNKVADQQEIMEFLTAVIRGEVTEPALIMARDGSQKVIEIKPGVNVRKTAAVDLGKRYAMWTEKLRVEGAVDVTFIDDIGGDKVET